MAGSEHVTVWEAFSSAEQGCPVVHAESVEILILMKNVLFYNKDINAQMVICVILDEEIYLD